MGKAAVRESAQPLVVDVPQAARMLGINRVSLYKLIAAGELDSCLVMKRLRRVTVRSVEAYLARQVAQDKHEERAPRGRRKVG